MGLKFPLTPRSGWGIALILTMGTVALIVLVVATFTVLDIRRERSVFREKEQQKGLFLATALNDILADYIYTADVDALSDIGQLLADKPDIFDMAYFQVFDAQGRILADSATHDYPVGVMSDDLSLQAAQTGETALRFNGDSLEFATPITAGSEIIGIARYGFNTDALNAEIKAIIVQHIWQGLAIILVGLVISNLLARFATRSLRALGEAAGNIGRGHLETPIPVGGPSETRKLGISLERMRAELQTLYAGLEQQVLERTRELKETAQGLESEVTVRQMAEQDLLLRNLELETLLTIANTLAGPGAFVQKCTDVLEQLNQLLQVDWVTLRQAVGEEQGLHLVAKVGPSASELPPLPVLTKLESLSATAFQKGNTIVVNDYAAHPEASTAIAAMGMKSVMMLPLRFHERRLGLISAASTHKDHFTPEMVRMFTAIGEGIGALFENTRLSQELQSHMEELAAVDEVSRILTSTLNIDQVYDDFAGEMQKLVPFDRVIIQVVDQDAGTVTLKYMFGQIRTGSHPGSVVPLAGTHTEQTMETGNSVLIADPDNVAGLRSSIVVPLVSKGRVLGSMMLSSREINAYGPREQAILERMAGQIAPAVENSLLFQEVQQLGLALESIGDAVNFVDLDGNIQFINGAFEDIYGYPSDQAVGRHLSMLSPTKFDSGGGIQEILDSARDGVWSGETVQVRNGGAEFPVHLTVAPVRDRSGQVLGFVGVTQDITARKLAEEALRDAEQRYRLIFENASDAIITFNLDSTITSMNPEAEAMTGYSERELVGQRATAYLTPASAQLVEERMQQWLAGGKGPPTIECEGVRKDGVIMPFEGRTVFIRDEDGTPVGYQGIFRDIRERKIAEEDRRGLEVRALAQSKLATLGQVATGVAHEINQPLTYISTFIQALQEDLELQDLDEEKLKPRLAEALRQVSRIDGIVRHLRTFGRGGDTEISPVNLETIVDNTLLLLGGHLRATNIQVERHIDPDLPLVMGNANKLEEVFINLFQNSSDAFWEDQVEAEIHVTIRNMPEEGTIQVQFSDNGVGIAPAHQDRIFEPFFTTKEEGKGTGLGLSIIYGIVMDHHGTITCESEYNKGTTITITLPVGEESHA